MFVFESKFFDDVSGNCLEFYVCVLIGLDVGDLGCVENFGKGGVYVVNDEGNYFGVKDIYIDGVGCVFFVFDCVDVIVDLMFVQQKIKGNCQENELQEQY